ncbi:hypothetical protein [Chitinimonas sp. BJYL2]|uniref:hypothetical protein n=1 Tax=Chitinimonas sp. BJYL2 TaxID=2976696 RepID=UPI0022B3CDA1|nr:hypothetical protein [Chitinimonas sp. BJYL2]
MNKHSESNTHHGASKTDGIDPKTGEHKAIPNPNPYEPASVPGPKQPLTEPTDTPPIKGPVKDESTTDAVHQETARTTRAVKQGTEQFLGYSQLITLATSDVIQRYFTTIERNTQRYCYAINAYLDAFRDELTHLGHDDEDDQDAARRSSAMPYAQRARADSGRSDTRSQNSRT